MEKNHRQFVVTSKFIAEYYRFIISNQRAYLKYLKFNNFFVTQTELFIYFVLIDTLNICLRSERIN